MQLKRVNYYIISHLTLNSSFDPQVSASTFDESDYFIRPYQCTSIRNLIKGNCLSKANQILKEMHVFRKWKRNNGDKVIFVTDFESCDESMSGDKTNKYTDLSSLTIDNIIGQGKYGIVYKGQIVDPVIIIWNLKLFDKS